MGREGASGVLALMGDVIAASSALAGLIVVYLGSVVASYASYDRTQQGTVRASFQRRAWFAVIGVVLAIAACGCAVMGKWLTNVCWADGAMVLLGLTLVWVIATACAAAAEVH